MTQKQENKNKKKKARKQNKTQQQKNPNVWSYDNFVTESEGKYKVLLEIMDLDLFQKRGKKGENSRSISSKGSLFWGKDSTGIPWTGNPPA